MMSDAFENAVIPPLTREEMISLVEGRVIPKTCKCFICTVPPFL